MKAPETRSVKKISSGEKCVARAQSTCARSWARYKRAICSMSRRQRVIDVLLWSCCRAREGYRDREPVWLGINACTCIRYRRARRLYSYTSGWRCYIYVHAVRVSSCTARIRSRDRPSGVRVERARCARDNLMGNNHDIHRTAHTPP